ncbi:hypothetical protein BKA66DRAFT_544094 [Pyrenochaeta sp. MPI-SDFR-AT-0127]|nr:hypothetical protein BKA66DRAFT_544094 [Pyrenochaeta sp. MPI-SDFR-AT-0127]
MRRIPRPSRAIDPSYRSWSCARQRVSVSSCTYLRTASAAFSTTSPNSFLLPGKQDKKKHQQFVRRWQKRLLGDSEPIGAHVDPYDPTSPVRIAPEEQGEYEEVLDEDRSDGSGPDFPLYKPAEDSRKLLHVGGEQWLKQKFEADLAKEFEKLTGRTYTPLTLEMANEIEELTGTPYTLRDENLMMAQTVHHVTGRPYTDYNFGLRGKTTMPKELRSRFAQAIAEIYTLKQAGLDMDISKLANRGVYASPRWVRYIRLIGTKSSEIVLAFPKGKTADQFLQVMQKAPTWDSIRAVEEDDLLAEDATNSLEPVLLPEQLPTMDPDTPAFKRAAVTKVDPDKKPFDFMSNRPVPRAKPVEKVITDNVFKVEEPRSQRTARSPASPADLASAVELSGSAVIKLRRSFIEHRTSRLADNIAALRNAVQLNKSDASALNMEAGSWRHISIADLTIKFALFKRLFQLTGLYISDPQLASVNTLGDLYSCLCVAARPQPTSLFSAIHIEGQKARARAKHRAPSSIAPQRRVDLGDLIRLGNVELRRVKPTKTEKRTNVGLNKVVQYALWERGLGVGTSRKVVQNGKKILQVVEGTRQAPEFGKPVSSKGASFLAKKTRQWAEEQESLKRASLVR